MACVVASVPFCTQAGHTGLLCRPEPGRPIPYLDEVLLDFPELTVVGGHVGGPWIEEVPSFGAAVFELLCRHLGLRRSPVACGARRLQAWSRIQPCDVRRQLADAFSEASS